MVTNCTTFQHHETNKQAWKIYCTCIWVTPTPSLITFSWSDSLVPSRLSETTNKTLHSKIYPNTRFIFHCKYTILSHKVTLRLVAIRRNEEDRYYIYKLCSVYLFIVGFLKCIHLRLKIMMYRLYLATVSWFIRLHSN